MSRSKREGFNMHVCMSKWRADTLLLGAAWVGH